MDFFMNMNFLIDMTFTFTVTAAVILAAKGIFKDRFSPKWHVLIWVVLLVRLLLPAFPESNFSIFNMMPDASETYNRYVEEQSLAALPSADQYQQNSGISGAGEDAVKNEELTGIPGTEAAATDFFGAAERVLLSLYYAGAAVMFTGLLFSYRKTVKRLQHLPKCRQQEFLSIFENCKKSAGVNRRNLPLRTGAPSPMLAGVFNPTVYISEHYNEEEIQYVFIHELCHYKSGDTLWNVVSSVCLCLNWFNPLAWYAFRSFRRDLEIYCDYRAVQITGRKKDYAEVLLKTAAGGKSFLFATSCLESGEKEVSTRIKRLAAFKQPKLWVSIAGVVLVIALGILCLTDGGNDLKSAETIAVAGPANQWAEYMMDIPSKWVASSETVVAEEAPYNEKQVFYDKDGNETLCLEYRVWGDKEYAEPEDAVKELARRVSDLASDAAWTNHINRGASTNILSGPTPVTTSGIFMVYEAQYYLDAEEGSKEDKGDGAADGKELFRQELYLPLEEDCSIVPVLYTNNPALVSRADLIEIAKTLTKSEEPTMYRPTASAQLLSDAQKGIAIPSGDYDAEKLLDDYLQNYVDTKLPVERAIKGYKINSMERVTAAGDLPGMVDEGVNEGENLPWNIIYPSARVYKIDYELIPQNPEKYRDLVGGGFEQTSKGNKRYTESYGVFYGYSVDGKTSEAAFVGFLHPSSLGEYGLDYSVYSMLTGWYDDAVWPRVLENAKVKYVGDASAVEKLVGMLPLHEYYSGMELQTTTEPYDLTVNYTIGRTEDYDAKTGGSMAAWPEIGGDISGIYSNVAEQGHMNQYIFDRLMDNNIKLVNEGIGNIRTAFSHAQSPYVIGIYVSHGNNQKRIHPLEN